MQHPVGHSVGEDGLLHLEDFAEFVFNSWAHAQYAHNMMASVVTASFVISAVGAYWALRRVYVEHSLICLRVGVVFGLLSSVLVAFPTGDRQGKLLALHQPVTLAAAEGLFDGGPYAELAIIGQPNLVERKLENPVVVPGMLSFLIYGTFGSTVKGLNEFPQSEWPGNVELLYYSYHIMAGLGTIFILTMALSAFLLWRNRLQQSRRMLWVLMLAFPFPYIATTAGWWTAELGRQPWLVHGLLRTADGGSPQVGAGDVVFTTLGYAGLYLALGFLFALQVLKEIYRGPESGRQAAIS
jgi:cytochrome d ubiquinol oxidase subunit I